MIQEILATIFNFIRSRVFILAVFITALFAVLLGRVFQLQIVNSDSYVAKYSQKYTKTRYYSSNRGNIYDADGKLLAYNVSVYSVVMEDAIESSAVKSDTLNKIIYDTFNIVEKYGDKMDSDFPIIYENGKYQWSPTLSEYSRLRFLKDIFGTNTLDTEKEKLSDTTPAEAIVYLAGPIKYSVDLKKYNEEEALKIIIARFNLSLNAYQKYLTTTLASDVSDETVAAIYESADKIPGVKISQTTKRVYKNAEYFAHVIGYTGKISDEQMAEYNAKIDDEHNKYNLNDEVGKTGIEGSMELELSGKKGYEKVLVDTTGKVLSVIEKKEAEVGNDVYLTIHSDLQKAIYHLIEQNVAKILLENIVNGEVNEENNKEWLIPIKRVYFQIINNNIVDMEHFSTAEAKENEKFMYNSLQTKKKTVLEKIFSELYNDEAPNLGKMTKEYNEYCTFLFNLLSDSSYGIDIIPRSSINTEDDKYKQWMRDELSLREMLLYAIDKNWVDTTKLDVDSAYIDRDDIYDSIIGFLKDYLETSEKFDKLLYKYLIYQGTISGSQVCRLLYDQNIFKYDDIAYNGLLNGSYSAYDFITTKLRNLEITPAMLALEPCSGAVTVVEPGTGNVLAMVSYPSYDNNSFSGSIDSETWNTLSSDLSNPLFGRATKMRVAPGSTLKPLAAVAGLETGVVSTGTYINCAGSFTTITPSPKCWIYPGGHGGLEVIGAIKNSCNVFFYEVGYRLSTMNGSYNEQEGLAHLRKYGEMMGLTTKSGVEVEEYEPSCSNENPIPSMIGQGTHSYVSSQLARYVNCIASDGVNYELTLIKKIKDREGKKRPLPEKNVKKIEASDETINALVSGMQQAATGYPRVNALNLNAAAKSGTSQENANLPDHALMISFVPADDPVISMSVTIQNGYKSANAAALTADIMDFVFERVTLKQILAGDAEGPADLSEITNDDDDSSNED